VFLNTDYDAYVLNDINPDLICLYNHLKLTPDSFIAEARKLFVAEHNHKAAYYRLRTQFNQTETTFERALLFLFLNRHGFNGLCLFPGKRAVGLCRKGAEGDLYLRELRRCHQACRRGLGYLL